MPARVPNPPLADPAARTILREWRRLTGGRTLRDAARRTLVACSGGADSLALTVALSRCPRSVVVAHVVHDLRPPAETNADRDLARLAAQRLGLAFDERAVHVPRRGNLEAAARKVRYAALAQMAEAHQCRFIAVAHQGDDLVETLLMRLVRGSGPRGLGVMPDCRDLATLARLTLIRPMLRLTRADAERLCTRAGLTWATDATNADTTRLRARIRADIMPTLREISPDIHRRALHTSALVRDAADLADERATALLSDATLHEDSIVFSRSILRREPRLVIGLCLRLGASYTRSAAGIRRADRLSSRHLSPAIRAIQSPTTDPKHFTLASIEVHVTAKQVHVRRRP